MLAFCYYKESEKFYGEFNKSEQNNNFIDFIKYLLEMFKDFLEKFYFLKMKLIKNNKD